jgi:peroxidase
LHCHLDMASSKLSPCLIFLQVVFLVLVFNSANAQLRVGFYKDTCPKAEAIVEEVMHQVMKVAPSLSGPLLRMHFHDCFVRVCEPLIHL